MYDLFARIYCQMLKDPAWAGTGVLISIIIAIWGYGKDKKNYPLMISCVIFTLLLLSPILINNIKITPEEKNTNETPEMLIREAIQIGAAIRNDAKHLMAAKETSQIAESSGRRDYADIFKQLTEENKQRFQDKLARYGAVFLELERYDHEIVLNLFRKIGEQSISKQLISVELIQNHFQQFLQKKILEPENWGQDFISTF